MRDPFEALASPPEPVVPEVAFAARLRARIAARLAGDPGGQQMAADTSTAARTREGDIVYVSLLVPDVERATAFYGAVLGWSFAPGSGERGRQVEATTPRHGMWGGQERSTLFLCFSVEDVDAATMRVRDAGGTAQQPRMEPYGRVADCVDNQGTAFALVESAPGAAPPRGPANGARHGDLAYVTMEVPDSAAARAFYGTVLGWRFHPGRAEDGWQLEDVVPMTGLHGGHGQTTTVPMYLVDDIAASVARVRSAGGKATDPVRQPYGLQSDCVDDQGTRFYLGEL